MAFIEFAWCGFFCMFFSCRPRSMLMGMGKRWFSFSHGFFSGGTSVIYGIFLSSSNVNYILKLITRYLNFVTDLHSCHSCLLIAKRRVFIPREERKNSEKNWNSAWFCKRNLKKMFWWFWIRRHCSQQNCGITQALLQKS